MLANLATALFEHGRITTTEAKAKRLRPLAERLITFAKRGDLHARRQVLTVVRDKGVVHKLFTEIGPRFENRHGGYTRITKIGPRKGDNAPMAVIELVEALTAHRPRSCEAEGATRRTGRKGAAKKAAGSCGRRRSPPPRRPLRRPPRRLPTTRPRATSKAPPRPQPRRGPPRTRQQRSPSSPTTPTSPRPPARPRRSPTSPRTQPTTPTKAEYEPVLTTRATDHVTEPAAPDPGDGGLVRVRLDLAYDGTDFAGWARQPGQRTVQGELEDALATVLRLADGPG